MSAKGLHLLGTESLALYCISEVLPHLQLRNLLQWDRIRVSPRVHMVKSYGVGDLLETSLEAKECSDVKTRAPSATSEGRTEATAAVLGSALGR